MRFYNLFHFIPGSTFSEVTFEGFPGDKEI